MKTLIIARHAKSSWDNPLLKDVDRPLNQRGLRDANAMATRLAEADIVPDLLITSNAKRAHMTAEIFNEKFKLEKDLIVENSLYLGDIEEFIHATFLIPETANVAMMFGHNPGITFFANVVCEANIENVPTCGILVIQSKAEKWEDTDISDLQLQHFLYPKQEV